MDRHVREGRGDRTAIICGDQIVTYAQLATQVGRVGNALHKFGVQQGQRVLLLLPDCPEFAFAYFGAMKIGAVAVPSSTFVHSDDYSFFLRESRATILIVHDSLYAEVAPALSEQPFLQHLIVCGGLNEHRLNWESWLEGCSQELDCEATGKDDPAFWLWTSGSTGRPGKPRSIGTATGAIVAKAMLVAFSISDRRMSHSPLRSCFTPTGLATVLCFRCTWVPARCYIPAILALRRSSKSRRSRGLRSFFRFRVFMRRCCRRLRMAGAST